MYVSGSALEQVSMFVHAAECGLASVHADPPHGWPLATAEPRLEAREALRRLNAYPPPSRAC
jgi:hypothetical protein